MKAIILIAMVVLMVLLPANATEIAPLINDVKIDRENGETVITAIVIPGTQAIDYVYADVRAFADLETPLGAVDLYPLIEHGNIYTGRFTVTKATDGYQVLPIHVADITGNVTIDRRCYASFAEPQELHKQPQPIPPLINDITIDRDDDGGVVTAVVVPGTLGVDVVHADVSLVSDDELVRLDPLVEHGNIYIGRFNVTESTDGYQELPVHVTDGAGNVTTNHRCYVSFEAPVAHNTPFISNTPLISAILILVLVVIAAAIYAKRKR